MSRRLRPRQFQPESGKAHDSSIPGDAFNTVLVHTLILHGLGRVHRHLAGLGADTKLCSRQCWRSYPLACTSGGGITTQTSKSKAGGFSTARYSRLRYSHSAQWVDCDLEGKRSADRSGYSTRSCSAVSRTLSPPTTFNTGELFHPLTSSADTRPAVTLVGCSIILLFVSFFSSTLPVFGRFARYKLSYAKGWRDLEEASDGAELARQAQDAEMGRDDGGEVVKRKRKGRTRRRMRDRMTRMFA